METAQALWSKRVKHQVSLFLMRHLRPCGRIAIDLAFLIGYFFQENLDFFQYMKHSNILSESTRTFSGSTELSPRALRLFLKALRRCDFYRDSLRRFPRSFRLFSESTRTFSEFSPGEPTHYLWFRKRLTIQQGYLGLDFKVVDNFIVKSIET